MVAAAGFTDVSVQGLDGGMWLGPDAGSAHDLAAGLLGFLLDGLDDDRRQDALRALRETIEAHTGPDGVRFSAATWLVTGRRGQG